MHFSLCKWLLQSCASPGFSHSSLCFNIHPTLHVYLVCFSFLLRSTHFRESPSWRDSQPASKSTPPQNTTQTCRLLAACGDFSGYIYTQEGNCWFMGYVTKWVRGIPEGSASILPLAGHRHSTCPHPMCASLLGVPVCGDDWSSLSFQSALWTLRSLGISYMLVGFGDFLFWTLPVHDICPFFM